MHCSYGQGKSWNLKEVVGGGGEGWGSNKHKLSEDIDAQELVDSFVIAS